ncbi:MAG: MFS transporter [Chloroflexi bacterium]|nr:MFS transporter [Chloroflexota bacterium]
MHVVNDLLFVAFTPLLPLMAADLSLSYAQVGAIKAAFSGASSAFQVPAGIAAERFGEQVLLALGTGWVGLGILAVAAAPAFWLLLVAAAIGGLGGNFQHPIATAIISRLYEGRGRTTAIGTLNFTGDLGKVLAPLIAGGIAVVYGWRGALVVVGAIGVAYALLHLVAVPEPPGAARAIRTADDGGIGWGITHRGGFMLLVTIGVLDSAARGTSLTLIPFVLTAKDFTTADIAAAFTALFAAGAAGKFLCGPIADRFGSVGAIVVTEVLTAAGIVATLFAPPDLAIVALLPLGFALNGTSSVLYASVSRFVDVRRRARGYGLYFTCTLLASALAPIAYGVVADLGGLSLAMMVLAAATLLIAPLAVSLRGPLAIAARAN